MDFSKIKVNKQVIDDATLKLGNYAKFQDSLYTDKGRILRAIKDYNLIEMRQISDIYYRASGIYAELIKYMASIYRFDWYITPYINETSSGGTAPKSEKILSDFHSCLEILDNFNVKKNLGEIALKVLRQGAYYGYKIESPKGIVLQELPVNYCRSRYLSNGKPVVEFNMKYFDDNFRSIEQRQKILKLFPDEFLKGYVLYKQSKLPPDSIGDTQGWYILDVSKTERFTLNGEEYPAFISIIPLILDLDIAQDLDRKKTLQRLARILIQQMPLDKNGELIFDVEEAQQLHNNAVKMLANSVGIDVLTTFAEVKVEDLAEASVAASQNDDLERVGDQIYNAAGISKLLFNSDNSTSLERSIANDEASMSNLLFQFEEFLNELLAKYNTKPKKITYRVSLLNTTIYNFKDLAKLYKEQAQLGYSKILPQVALGQSQSSILATAYFENKVLDLAEVFIPPITANTNSQKVQTVGKGGGAGSSPSGQSGSSSTGGRPTNEEAGKVTTEKTAANKEAAASN